MKWNAITKLEWKEFEMHKYVNSMPIEWEKNAMRMNIVNEDKMITLTVTWIYTRVRTQAHARDTQSTKYFWPSNCIFMDYQAVQ